MDQSLTTLTRIAEDATRMSLIESERLTLEIEDCSVESTVHQAIEAANANAAGRSVAVTSEVQPGLPRVRFDGPRISLALANLIRNGIRFTPDGGRVLVRARMDEETILIEVEDNGIGIPEEQLRRLFDRAWQAPPSDHHHSSNTLEFNSAGLSLGLSITRGIVEAHEGAIEISSEVGKGTLVRLRVPAQRPDELEAA